MKEDAIKLCTSHGMSMRRNPDDPGGRLVQVPKCAKVADDVWITIGTVIGCSVEIYDSSTIGKGVRLGDGVRIGTNVTLHAGIRVAPTVIVHCGFDGMHDGNVIEYDTTNVQGSMFSPPKHRGWPQPTLIVMPRHLAGFPA